MNKAGIQAFYNIKLSEGKTPINDKMYFNAYGLGALIVPKDGSYLHFIANTWYDKETLTEVLNRPIMDQVKISVFEFMEDFDNWGLDFDDRRDVLEESITLYNSEHGTEHVPSQMFREYEVWRRREDR